MKPIYLYLPSSRRGGSEIFFEDLFHHFKKHGYQVRNLVESDQQRYADTVSIFSGKESESEITEGGLILTSFQFIDRLPFDQIPINSKIVLFVLHKHHIYRCLLFGALYKSSSWPYLRKLARIIEYRSIQRTQKLFNEMDSSGAVVFFSKSSQNEVNRVLLTSMIATPMHLPYPSIGRVKGGKQLKSDNLIMCWVGRLDHDMLQPLLTVIDSLVTERSSIPVTKITLKIFGDGDGVKRIKDKLPKSIEIEFKGLLFGQDLYEYLVNHVDVGIGRGRVCLDFMNQGIPFINIPLEAAENKRTIYSHGYEGYEKEAPRYSISDILCQIMSNYSFHKNQSIHRMHDFSLDRFSSKLLDSNLVQGVDPLKCEDYVKTQTPYIRLKDYFNSMRS